MDPHKLQKTAVALLLLLSATSVFARPLEFSELSLLVRAHENEASIISIASQRKLIRPLTRQQESTLRAQGAPDSLLRSLHNSNLQLSESEAAAYDAASSPAAAVAAGHPVAATPSDARRSVQIIDVAVDRPVNLSVWGGPDAELAFRARDIVDTGADEAQLIQPVGTGVHYATYHGYRVPGWEPVDPQYTSIVEHTYTRPLHIGWSHPVRISNVPYLLYPVYAVHGVSLYYVGRISDDLVRLAVISG